MRSSRRSVVLAGTGAAAIVLLAGSAFGCGAIATLELKPATGTAGSEVVVTGSQYVAQGTPVPVVLKWNGINGEELARGFPDRNGSISVKIRVPQGSTPGYYVVVGVQRDAMGLDSFGTPTRASFQVVEGPPATAAPAAPVALSRPNRSADGPPGVPLVLGALALAIVAGGVYRHRQAQWSS